MSPRESRIVTSLQAPLRGGRSPGEPHGVHHLPTGHLQGRDLPGTSLLSPFLTFAVVCVTPVQRNSIEPNWSFSHYIHTCLGQGLPEVWYNLLKRRGCRVVWVWPKMQQRVCLRKILRGTFNQLGNKFRTRWTPRENRFTTLHRGFSTDCHSNQISTVNKRTE